MLVLCFWRCGMVVGFLGRVEGRRGRGLGCGGDGALG